MTTPNAVALQRLLYRFAQAGCQRVALEVSSHALAQGRAREVAFRYAIFSNLTRDHLDYHGTLEAYREAKRRLFTEWPLLASVLNIDDDFGRALVSEARGEVVTVGADGDWRYGIASRSSEGLQVDWQTPFGPVQAELAVA